MFLALHTAAAIVISESLTSRVVGFLVGILSHFILDFFPHGDKGLDDWINKKSKQKLLRTMVAALIDIAVMAGLVLIFLKHLSLTHPEVAYWTAVGAIAPDLIWGFYVLTGKRIKLFGLFTHVHHWFQNIWKDTLSLKTGFIVQIILFIILITVQIMQ